MMNNVIPLLRIQPIYSPYPSWKTPPPVMGPISLTSSDISTANSDIPWHGIFVCSNAIMFPVN
jgi:hypothetical protein